MSITSAFRPPPGVAILMYHEVADRPEMGALAGHIQGGYILLREDFERQMAFLATAGFQSASLQQLHDWSQLGAPLPARPVVITFDDGYGGNYRHAFPILERYGLSATFFIISNRIGTLHMLSWEALREMQRHGMAIGSHTANHPLLSTLDEDRTRDELVGSKRAIEDRLGSPVGFLSLPNGDSNPFYVSVAQGAGYLGGCGSRFGFNTRSTERYFWNRQAIKQGVPLARFRNLLERRPATVLYYTLQATAKQAIARTVGKETYDRIYNRVFGVRSQDPSDPQ
ncbi:MAG: polysaccharide deacetylase family protein [Gammaproteobacteria bacterium]